MARSVRMLVVALVALAAWLVAGTAMAAAPLCDDRGASALAPPPTLDTPNESIDIGMSPEACGYAVDDGSSLHQGRAADPLPAPASAELLPVATQGNVLAATGIAMPVDLTSSKGRAGECGRLERPPRPSRLSVFL
jgi:hypothetical protein